MQRWPLLAALLLAARAAAESSAAAVTPVQKVIHMLEGMLSKGKEEKHAEQVQFAAFKQFCDDTTAEKRRLIKEAGQDMEMMKAEIQKLTSDAQQLTMEIAALDADIATWNGDKKAVAKVREIEKADYDAMHKDYSESVDALQRAIQILKKQAFDRSQASLAQVKSLRDLKLIPEKAKKAIDLFVQDMDDPAESLAVSAPEAAGYEFQSHGLVDMLEKLEDKFVDMRTTMEKEEMNARHSADLLTQDLAAQIAQATSDRGQKAATKAKALQGKADTEGDLTETSTTKAADEKYLSDLVGSCGQKGGDFEQRQQLRAEELEAMSKAIEILSGDAVKGNAEKYLPSFLQLGKSSALTQLRTRAISPVQAHAAQYLRERASSLNSRVLSALATHVADDPFGKVKKLIKDLITRLMEEANEEAQHKGWCDTELSTNEQTRKEKSEAVETLHAEIDNLQSSLAQLQDDITELSKTVAGLDSDMAKATQMRQEQKQTNLATVKDSQDAQAAVAQALVVLKEFYAKAGDSTALVQKKGQQEPPSIFDGAYQGMQAEKGGVIGMLEVIQSDFARLEAETAAEEATAQKEYDEFITDSKVDKAQKSKDIEYKSAKKQDQTQAMTMKQNDLEGTQKELDAALMYYDRLKPSCVDAGTSYDDRVSRRKEEIESLQEALRILNGEDLA